MTLSASSRDNRRRKRRAETNSKLKSRAIWLPYVKFDAGNKKQGEGDKQEDAARRRELVQQRPEKLFDNRPRPLPARKFADFVPIDVFAVEAVAGARVGGKLRPKIFDGAAFADTLPEVVHGARSRWGAEAESRGSVEEGALMDCQYKTLVRGAQPGAGN